MRETTMQRKHSPRLVAMVLVVAGLGLLAGPAAATSFSDVGEGHPFQAEIDDVSDRGIMTGYPDGTFRSTWRATRQAMAVVLFREAGSPAFDPPGSVDRSFVDVRPDHPFYAEIEWAAAEGLVQGWPTDQIDPETGPLPEYRPSAPISRGAVAVLLHRFAGSPAHEVGEVPRFNDVLGGIAGPEHPFRVQIEWTRADELLFGWDGVGSDEQCVDYGCDGWFRPAASITRQALAAVLSRFHQQVTPR